VAELVTMPKLGLTMTEGTVSKWCKSEGDAVNKGDVLFEVSTDKITNQVEADAKGILRKVLVPEGGVAPVTAPVAIIAEEGEDITLLLNAAYAGGDAAAASEEKVEASIDKAQDTHVVRESQIKASPAAKKMAKDNKVVLSLIRGTGPEGRIIEKDIKAYIESKEKVKVSPTAAKLAADHGVDVNTIDKQGRVMKEDVIKAIPAESKALLEDTRVSPSQIRRVIAERMSISWSTSPRVTYNMEIDVSQMKAFRENLNEICIAQGVKLSYNHIIMKICAKALTEFPYINASFDGREIILHRSVNIGMAVALEGGLIVPNVKDVQSKSLLEIAVDTERLVKAARESSLKPDDMTGGTFTITNLGMFGIETFSPIINQPELAILAVNAIIDRPVAREGQVVIRPMMMLSLTADHRVIDGAVAAKFLARLKQLMENPCLLLL